VGHVTAGSIISDFHNSRDPFSFEVFKQRKFYDELIILGKMLSKASQPEYTLAQKVELIIEYYAPILKERADEKLALIRFWLLKKSISIWCKANIFITLERYIMESDPLKGICNYLCIPGINCEG